MKFDIDVLIIFSSRDNESPDTSETGWISQFRKFLEMMLTQVLGEKANIVLKDDIDSLTSPDLDNAATLVTILSKNFIQSGQCLDYVETFFKSTSRTNPKINRVFKVFKSPLAINEQPPRLSGLFGYDMYKLDVTSGQPSEYTDYFNGDAELHYWMKMVDLAYDIYDTILQLKDEGSPKDARLFQRKTIYLAETGHDMAVQRNIIRRELQRDGYLVLPNQSPAGYATDLETRIQKEVQEADLSIHLISAAYGEILGHSEKSLPEIQLQYAAQKSKVALDNNVSFSRLIWVSPTIAQASEKQKSFVERIRADVETHHNTEILEMPIEDFKMIMREELLERSGGDIANHQQGQSVYLIYDSCDEGDVGPLQKLIESQGFKVLKPLFEGDVMQIRRKHIENLLSFDAAIIFKGKVNEQWVRMKALDLLKSPGYGRKKSIVAKAIVMGPESQLDLDYYKNQDIRVLQGNLDKTMDSVKNLLREFED